MSELGDSSNTDFHSGYTCLFFLLAVEGLLSSTCQHVFATVLLVLAILYVVHWKSALLYYFLGG